MLTDNCCHCELDSFAYRYILESTSNFSIVCDVHPLREGHLLIIPKAHIACVGAYPFDIWSEFRSLYKKCISFLVSEYGDYSTFEHGVIGQTVFHSHVHLLPGRFEKDDIVSEGDENFCQLASIEELISIFKSYGHYLFVSLGDSPYTVNTSLARPRFFRDRFAAALRVPERGDWKSMREDKQLMARAEDENSKCQSKWQLFIDASKI